MGRRCEDGFSKRANLVGKISSSRRLSSLVQLATAFAVLTFVRMFTTMSQCYANEFTPSSFRQLMLSEQKGMVF